MDGADGLANSLITKGGEYQTMAPDSSEFDSGWDWKHLYNPRLYTTKVAEGVPFTLAMMPLSLIGAEAGAATATTIGLSILGKKILTVVGGAALSTLC